MRTGLVFQRVGTDRVKTHLFLSILGWGGPFEKKNYKLGLLAEPRLSPPPPNRIFAYCGSASAELPVAC